MRRVRLKKPVKFYRVVFEDCFGDVEFFVFKARNNLWIVLSEDELHHGFYEDDVLMIKAKDIDELVANLWIYLLEDFCRGIDPYDDEEYSNLLKYGLAYVEEYKVSQYLKVR